MTLPFSVPAHARPAWDELHAQIIRTGTTPCAGPDRDLWIGTQAEQHIAADRCMDCPVMPACLTYARAADETEGVWGGTTPRERRKK